MDALAAELIFLEGEKKKKGKAPADTIDMQSYYALLKEKTRVLTFFSRHTHTHTHTHIHPHPHPPPPTGGPVAVLTHTRTHTP
jgi:hypothetical protein